jgi:polysaccharide biosynthesis/export protein
VTQPARTTCFGGLRRAGGALALFGLAIGLGGCSHWDTFLDPSFVGAWEHTPTKVPILTRIATIEDEPDQFVDYSEIRPGDLIPESEPYRLGPGDALIVTVYDLIIPNQPQIEQRNIDQLGFLEYPQLGRIYLSGLTELEAEQAIAAKASEFVDDPLVSVSLQSRRQQAFHLMGAVRSPGPYGIPSTDYRLLEALIAAGGISETAKYVHVIRQVPLRADVGGPMSAPPPSGDMQAPSGEELLDIIDDLSGEGDPGALPTRSAERLDSFGVQPETGGASGDEREPMIDLLDPAEPSGQVVDLETESADRGNPMGGSRWVFLNGEWVMARHSAGHRAAVEAGDSEADFLSGSEMLVTQRVIRVRVAPLLAGDARYNIVVRPGDIIRVPLPEAGNVYIDGKVNRPGVYTLPATGRLTLTRAMTAAGGLGGLAIPERVDLTRMVGDDQQATIMLDLRAIAQGTQPDVYLKPDDRINVGTNFWAFPLAVIRNGFRMSYGFGFLLDRNFGNDVFGAPPFRRN